jgi:hypothetical protein
MYRIVDSEVDVTFSGEDPESSAAGQQPLVDRGSFLSVSTKGPS